MSDIMLNRRQALKLGLSSAAILALAGCGGSGDSGSSEGASGEKKDSYKVAMIMSGTITDGGWDQGHYESLKRAVEKHSKWTILDPKEFERVSRAYMKL